MRQFVVNSLGSRNINLEDEEALYVGMYRGCRLQVSDAVELHFSVIDAGAHKHEEQMLYGR